ncbi:cwf18 pre-mRNA splicing factor isoform X1 [Carex rostrata]
MGGEEEAIDQASAARRERLRALRAAKELLSTPDSDQPSDASKQDRKNITNGGEEPEENNNDKLPNMKFRNYLPHDKQLQEGKLAPVALPKFEDPVVVAPIEPQKAEDPFLNIAPKKPNWDLKRDVQKKLDKLEKRTQKALYELALEQQREKEASEAEDVMVES